MNSYVQMQAGEQIFIPNLCEFLVSSAIKTATFLTRITTSTFETNHVCNITQADSKVAVIFFKQAMICSKRGAY